VLARNTDIDATAPGNGARLYCPGLRRLITYSGALTFPGHSALRPSMMRPLAQTFEQASKATETPNS